MGIIPQCVLIFVLVFHLNFNNATNFSQVYFGVYFDPFLSSSNDPSDTNLYSERHLEARITMVSSEFRHFYMAPIGTGLASAYIPRKEIPKAVAMLNKLNPPDQIPIRITMAFTAETGDLSNFDVVKGLADEANSIFPSTVQTLLLEDWGLTADTLNSSLLLLNNVWGKINASRYDYKFGANLAFDRCGKTISNVDPNLIPVLPLLQLVFFDINPHGEAFRNGVSRTVQQFSNLFANCKAKIKASSPTTEVGFSTQWLTDPKDEFAEASDLPLFWRRLHGWAVSTKTTVIVFRALDSPPYLEPKTNSGWWRLSENLEDRDADDVHDYAFETKEEAYTKWNTFSGNLFGVFFSPYVSNKDVAIQIPSYSVKELVSMVKIISQKFRTILMPPIEIIHANGVGNAILNIPKAVALFNKEFRRADQQSVRLIMQFGWEGVESKSKHNLWCTQTAIKLADEANAIFPATVQVLVLSTPKRTLQMIPAARNAIQSSTSKNHYKLGIFTSTENCVEQDVSYWFRAMRHSQLLIYNDIHFADYALGVEKFTKKLRQQFNNCNKLLAKYKLEHEARFLAYWPDAWNETGRINRTSLGRFWKDMNEWAVESNTSVILQDAFDSPVKKSPFNRLGWWRLVENTSYKDATEYVFEEKQQIDYLEKRSITRFLTPPTNVGRNFSRRNTGVWFDKNVMNGTYLANRYSTEELIILISKIYSRFSIIVMRSITTELPDDDMLDIPSAIATFNKNHKPPGLPNAQLIMAFALDNTWKEGNAQTSFHRVKQLADEANQIFPNTVEILLLENQELGDDPGHVPSILEKLSFVKSLRSSLKIPYKIGILLENDCTTSELSLKLLLNEIAPLPYIMFQTFSTYSDFELGSSLFLQKVTQDFQTCKSKVKAFSPSTEVSLHTVWPDTWNETTPQNVFSMVKFWTGMDEWAVSTNSVVILHEAFDVPLDKTPCYKCGWWRLVQNDSYRHAGDYVFEAKEDIVNMEKRKRQLDLERISKSRDATQADNNELTVTYLVTGIILLTIIIGVATSCYFHERVLNRQARYMLPKSEIRGFFDGTTSMFSSHPAASGITEGAYDHQRLEIPFDSFEIDEQAILGSGAFGLVLKGIINVQNVQLQVAVKTTKPTCPAAGLRGLLSEIKIMSHIGNHNFILGMAGAYTAELYSGKVYVFTEFCALGSLEKYLRQIDRPTLEVKFSKRHSANGADETSKQEVIAISTTTGMESVASDLEKWSYEIICGMEYLASKHVVHADLATRNVLLTENKTPKISDFGLSRKLYDYENYVKSQQEPLPWRWMSPESLCQMVFNEKTDVWSLGITLWEIFFLGDIPYPGMSWDVQWVTRLSEGLRLGKPEYDVNDRHSIMMKCWEADTQSRPTFSSLRALWDENDNNGPDAEIEYIEL